MPDALLTLLRLCVLALLYLFFVGVLRATWVGLRPVAAVPPAPARRSGGRAGSAKRAQQLVIVEPPEVAGRSYPLADEMTVGRAGGCHVQVDDTFASQLHARLFLRDGVLHVEDLGSTNGTFLNGEQVNSAAAVSRGDRVQVGRTVLELR